MKTRNSIVAFLPALLIFLSSMGYAQVSEQRAVQPFTGVEISAIGQVHLTQSSEYSLVVEAEEEHLPFLETIVKDGILQINYTRNARNPGPINIRVSAPEFTFLHAGGAGSITGINTINTKPKHLQLKVSGAGSMKLDVVTNWLTTEISGAGNIHLSGITQVHELSASGVSTVRAYDLEASSTKVKTSGTSNVRITTLDKLEAEAGGTSSINVRGNPAVTQYKTTGTASIRGVSRGMETASIGQSDTLIVRVGQREVVVTEGQRPTVRTQRATPRASWNDNWSGFYLGVNGYLNPDQSIDLGPEADFMDLEYNNSIAVNLNFWQVNLANTLGRRGGIGLFTGLGYSWNNYRFENNLRLTHEENQVEPEFSNVHDYIKTKLTVSHLNIPLMLEYQTRQNISKSKFHISAGVNLGFRMRSHTKQVYRDGGKVTDKDFQSFHLAPFRQEVVARIGWGPINLFASYAINEMFREDRGPELYPFTVGLRIVNF